MDSAPNFLKAIVKLLIKSGFVKDQVGKEIEKSKFEKTRSLVSKFINPNTNELNRLVTRTEKLLFYTDLFKAMVCLNILDEEQRPRIFKKFLDLNYIQLKMSEDRDHEIWDLHGHNEVTARYASNHIFKYFNKSDSHKNLVLIHGRGNHSKFGNSVLKRIVQEEARENIAKNTVLSIEYEEGRIKLIKNLSVERGRGETQQRSIVEGG